MEWIERLNSVVVYIEEHIAEEIEYDKLATIACCSSYHFQRLFAYLADVPLSDKLFYHLLGHRLSRTTYADITHFFGHAFSSDIVRSLLTT